ncbi:MAG: hypothetical protein V1742_06935, partial [Pseudomonadota bacterium]
MKRYPILPLALFILLFLAACAAPVRPAPQQRPQSGLERSLTQGVWFWQCQGGNPYKAFMQFLPNGTVRYDYNQGEDPSRFQYHNAIWRVEGNRLIVDYNKGYALDVYYLDQSKGTVLVGQPAKTRPC